ncbi:MAG: Gfo/Idh/MocA family oxidoreductase [SAR202 cluster bacterium]|nr:Gfo/Idh/MocA family oxidoreductase [SAR202 cluster bacterium]
MVTKPKLRVAIIGGGRIGGLLEDETPPNRFRKPHGHFAAYQTVPDVQVVAVAQRSPERAEMFKKRWGISNVYTDYRQMIEKERPDIVSVTTQAIYKAEIIVHAAEHGVKGIFAEKALCCSLEEADRIYAALKKNKVAFNYGAERRQHDGYQRLREAIAKGDIGEPKYAFCFWLSDLMKHHSHSLDTISFLLGDPKPVWCEGKLILKGDALDPGNRMGPREGAGMTQRPLPMPTLDTKSRKFIAPEGMPFADPYLDFSRIGYDNGTEAFIFPLSRATDFEVHGTEGRAFSWDDGQDIRVRSVSKKKGGGDVVEKTIRPSGLSPTVNTIKDLVRELQTGERTKGNIDVTMQGLEAEFGLAYSHIEGNKRIPLPVKDRSLYIPNH